MAIDQTQVFDAPIPGENWTSDPKDYPWHRPPDFVDLDEAVNYFLTTLEDEEQQDAVLALLDMGFDVATITDIIITKGIQDGRWSVDLGILLSGPISHVIVLLAKGRGEKFEMGLETENKNPSKAFFKELNARMESKPVPVAPERLAEEGVPPAPGLNPPSRGFLGGGGNPVAKGPPVEEPMPGMGVPGMNNVEGM